LPTIKEIAKLARVSPATVSRVLNNDDTITVTSNTKRRIFEIAEKLSYTKHLKKNKATKNKYRVALIHWYTVQQELQDPYFISIRMGIQRACKEFLINLDVLYNDSYLKDNLLAKSYDGFLILGRFDDQLNIFFESQNQNIVYVHAPRSNYTHDSVQTDFRSITKEVLEYLFSKNHAKIAYIGGQEMIPSTGEFYPDPRELEFKEVMYNKKIFDKNYFKVGNFSFESGYKLAQELLTKNINNLPTAIFCGNDSIALGAVRAILERKYRIPEDIAIFSVNDIPSLQYTSPSLSTVKIHSEFMGSISVKLLLERIKDERNLNLRVLIPFELILRESA